MILIDLEYIIHENNNTLHKYDLSVCSKSIILPIEQNIVQEFIFFLEYFYLVNHLLTAKNRVKVMKNVVVSESRTLEK